MKKVINYKQETIAFHARVAKTLPLLQKLKHEDNRIAFNRLMEKVLPKVKQYINKQFQIALKNNILPEGKYKVEDFTDELYIEAFDNILNLNEENHLHHWLFSKADELLEDTIVEEDFDSMFFKNIEDYTKKEWETMEENFTRDGDGDLVLLEELDHPSYPKDDYILADVFVENKEESIIEKLTAKMSKEEIQKQFEAVLFLLPFHLRTVFELSINQQFDAEEIASIKK